jgi:serine protease Do
MKHQNSKYAAIIFCFLLSTLCRASTTKPTGAHGIYTSAIPSLVAVQFTWESELGRRDLIGTGVVVSKDGLVAVSLALFNPHIPDAQMKDFKILVPSTVADPDEIEATFVGRDERTGLAFLRATGTHTWTPIEFQDEPLMVGDSVYSVGLLPKAAGYRPCLTHGIISADLHREWPMFMVSPGLATGGSPVFDSAGHAVGLVMPQDFTQEFLNDPRSALAGQINPPTLFLPSRGFLYAFSDLPTPDQDSKLAWIGVIELHGLSKDMNDYYGLKDQPALQIGDVIPGTPADKAGMKRGMIIVSMNGKPLERGDDTDQIPLILHGQILRMHIGDHIVFGVLNAPNQPPQSLTLTLAQRPASATTAKRYWADDLGFGVRETVFDDLYERHLPDSAKGVIVTMIKPQASAMIARLASEDMVTQVNGTPVANVAEFQKAYEALRKSKPTEAVLLVVLHEGNNQVIRIEPPQ